MSGGAAGFARPQSSAAVKCAPAGDRLWAVRDLDGKFGSGKNTRRFTADDPAGHRPVGELLARAVTLTPEGPVAHHDEARSVLSPRRPYAA